MAINPIASKLTPSIPTVAAPPAHQTAKPVDKDGDGDNDAGETAAQKAQEAPNLRPGSTIHIVA